MIWLSADSHYYHKNILKFCKRPWNTVAEMNEGLIANHNARVKKDEHWYHLGDFSFGGTKNTTEILKRLHGFKICIRGNHDPDAATLLKMGWDKVYENHELTLNDGVNKVKVYLSHFPYHPVLYHSNVAGTITSINDVNQDTRYLHKRILPDGEHWLLHGHVHEAWKVQPEHKMINVGVDVNDFCPVPHTTILKIISEHKNKL